jgi:hypothetical protein
MSVTKHVSEDEMKYNSIIETHKGLIELGRKKELDNFLQDKQKTDNNSIIDFLENYFINIHENANPKKKYYQRKSVAEIIDKSLNHIKNQNILISKRYNSFNQILKENLEILQENKELISQIDELEDKIETYWNPRVEKIRNICFQRNNTIKTLKKTSLLVILFIISQQCLINYFGFLRYCNIMFNISIGLTNLVYLIGFYTASVMYSLFFDIYLLKLQIISALYSWYIYYSFIISVAYNRYLTFYMSSYTNYISSEHLKNLKIYTNNSLNVCYIES